jgi:hypothetical protein
MYLQDDAYERDRGPCLTLYSSGGRVIIRFEEREYKSGTFRSSLHSTGYA